MKRVSALLERFPWMMQFIKFGLVGVSNLLVYYAIYSILLRFGCHYAIANGIGFVISVLNSFLWNSLFVFKKAEGGKRNKAATLLKTFISYALTGLVLQTLLLHLLAYIAPVLTVCVTTPLNFLLNKFWSFKESPGREAPTL